MHELQQSLNSMGVLQHLLAVAFLIFYSLAIGGFLGRESRRTMVLAATLSATAFILTSDLWVHGIVLTAFAVLSIGAYIALAWTLKFLCETALGSGHVRDADLRRSVKAATAGIQEDPVVSGATGASEGLATP